VAGRTGAMARTDDHPRFAASHFTSPVVQLTLFPLRPRQVEAYRTAPVADLAAQGVVDLDATKQAAAEEALAGGPGP
jgi:hypothetical protein